MLTRLALGSIKLAALGFNERKKKSRAELLGRELAAVSTETN